MSTLASHQPSNPLDSSNPALNIVPAMPARLVLVRHGESEANIINRAIKKGKIQNYPPGFSDIPDREVRLSKLGVEQALKTGPWLRAQYPEGFHAIYVSDHTRAKETAALVCKSAGWDHLRIRIDPLLGERNWGRFAHEDRERRDEIMRNRKRDPLHNPMPHGETLLSTRLRSRDMLERCAREFAAQRVLVFSHGEYIEAIWSEIAHMNSESQSRFFESHEGDIRNCQVVEFSSLDPQSNDANNQLKWARSSCPQAKIIGTWKPIERTTFTPEELLEQVTRYPNLDFPGL